MLDDNSRLYDARRVLSVVHLAAVWQYVELRNQQSKSSLLNLFYRLFRRYKQPLFLRIPIRDGLHENAPVLVYIVGVKPREAVIPVCSKRTWH